MTRETKIGLLIGLGFIVVFAVLLSYTAPPGADDLPLVLAERGGIPAGTSGGTLAPSGVSDGGVRAGDPNSGRGPVAAGGAERGEVAGRGESSDGLPRPDAFNPLPAAWRGPALSENTAPGGTPLSVTEPTAVVEIIRRVAPALREPIVAPEPTPRPDGPTESVEPVLPAPVAPAKSVPPVKSAPPKLYTVQAGDALAKIAKKFYGTASARVLDFLVSANKEQIKSKDMVVAGMQIKVPALPPELVEPATNFNAALINQGVTAVKFEELLGPAVVAKGEGTRQAPTPSKGVPVADPKSKEPTEKSGGKGRWYVIQPKDTLSSIAERELGSIKFWREIQKLNEKLDPAKMQVGTKIRLPGKPPAAETPTPV